MNSSPLEVGARVSLNRAQPMIYWIEHLIRHGGVTAPHIHSIAPACVFAPVFGLSILICRQGTLGKFRSREVSNIFYITAIEVSSQNEKNNMVFLIFFISCSPLI